MRRLTVPVVLAITLTLIPYVRREWRRAEAVAYLVTGSRDRTLHGKDRRRARRAGA